MLILTRRPGESIRVGDEITITLLGIKGNQVRLGIEAPLTIPVHRQEIYDRIQASARMLNMRVVSADGEVREQPGESGAGGRTTAVSHDTR